MPKLSEMLIEPNRTHRGEGSQEEGVRRPHRKNVICNEKHDKHKPKSPHLLDQKDLHKNLTLIFGLSSLITYIRKQPKSCFCEPNQFSI